MADAEREQEAVERDRPLLLDRRDHLGRPHAPILLPRGKLFLGQAEDIGGRFDQPVAEERLDQRLAEPADVERMARGEVDQPLDSLCRADQPAGAAIDDLAFLALSSRSAFGAGTGEDIGLALDLRGQVLDDLRDHVACALDEHAVAGPHAQALDLVGIVQRGVGHDDTTDGYRG